MDSGSVQRIVLLIAVWLPGKRRGEHAEGRSALLFLTMDPSLERLALRISGVRTRPCAAAGRHPVSSTSLGLLRGAVLYASGK